MKILLILGGGISGLPRPELQGRTPLETVSTPALDTLVGRGRAGAWRTAMRGRLQDSGAALQALIGCQETVPGGVLDALGCGLDLRADEFAFRANFVCLKPGPTSVLMVDPSGAGLTSEETTPLIGHLNENLVPGPGEELKLTPLGGPRAVLTYRRAGEEMPASSARGFSSPFDIVGMPVGDHLPMAPESRRFVHMVNDSQMILSVHPGLQEKAKTRMFTPNSLWLWEGGKTPENFPALASRLGGRRAALVAESDTLHGLARISGLDAIRPGAEGLVAAVRGALSAYDVVIAADEAGSAATRLGDWEGKMSAIEHFDREVVTPLAEDAGVGGDYRLAVLADSFPLSPEEAGPGAHPMPFVMADRIGGEFRPPPARGGVANLWRALRRKKTPAENVGFTEQLADAARPVRAQDFFSDLLRVPSR